MGEKYYYAVTRIHNREASLLTNQAVQQMMEAETYEDCVRVLKDFAWVVSEGMRPEEVLLTEQRSHWQLLRELLDDNDIFNLFRYEDDFNNLKAVIKLQHLRRSEELDEQYVSEFGTLPIETLREAASTGDFDKLPVMFAVPANAAYRTLLTTGSSQLADTSLDRACFDMMFELADKYKSDVMSLYLETKADTSNISTAIRGNKMKKTDDFFEIALIEGGTVSKKELAAAAVKSSEDIYTLLRLGKYSQHVDILADSLPTFQAKVESELIEDIQSSKKEIGGIDPIVAYIIAKENELKTVRLLLSANINKFSKDIVIGRIRSMYA